MYSLQKRLFVWLAASLTIMILVLLGSGYQSVAKMADDFIVERLESDIEGILSAIIVEDGNVKISDLRFSHIYDQPLSGHYFVLRYGDNKEYRSRSLWDYPLDFPTVAPGERRINHVPGPDRQNILVWVRGFRKDNVNFTLAIAEDHSHTHEQIDRTIRNIFILSFLGLVLLLAVQGFIVRRSLSSLKKVREERQEILEGSRSAFSDNVPQEILPLVEEANHLLGLLSQRLERSRNALGNLAHALKGPLSVVVQYFNSPDNMKNKTQFTQAGKQVQRIQELMDRELRRARLVGKGVSSKRFDPHAELPDLVGLLMQVYASKEVSLTYSVEPDTPSFGDREDMHELLGNLLDNACKWSVSRVHCRIYGEIESGIHIIVEDDGSGLSGDELDRLMSRGVRLDESVEGHGLGLSIVKDIVRLYSGEISFSRSESMGGLCVRVLIPCQAKLVQL